MAAWDNDVEVGKETAKVSPWARDPAYQEKNMLSQSRTRQDEIVGNIQTLMAEHGERVPEMLKHEFELQQSEIQRVAEQPMWAHSMEEHEKMLSELKSSQDEQQRIMDALLQKVSSRSTQDLQNASEMQMMRQSRARQDKILAKIAERRLAAKKAKEALTKPAPSAPPQEDIEGQLRSLSKQQWQAGQLSSKAAAAHDRAAWDNAQKLMDKLSTQEGALWDKLKARDPKGYQDKFNKLYDQIYDKEWGK